MQEEKKTIDPRPDSDVINDWLEAHQGPIGKAREELEDAHAEFRGMSEYNVDYNANVRILDRIAELEMQLIELKVKASNAIRNIQEKQANLDALLRGESAASLSASSFDPAASPNMSGIGEGS